MIVDMPGTPRGDSELLDFDELDRIEAERAAEGLAAGRVPQAETRPAVETKAPRKEEPFEDFLDVRVGMKVQVLSDAQAVLRACRETGIDTTYDEQRLASLGKVGSVQCKDPSDYTVRCKLPELGSIWFGIWALMPAALPCDEEETCRAPLLEPAGPDWMALGGIVAYKGADAGAQASAVDVMAELELEAAVERRLSEGERKGKLGSTFGVKDGSVDADGQPKWTFVADAVIAVMARFRKLSASPEAVARIGGEGLEFFLLAVAYFMCTALPCRFRSEASAYIERLVRLLQERRGFLPLVEELLGSDLSEAQVVALWKRLEASLRDCVACLRKFQGCLVSPTEAEEADVAASLIELEAITTSGLEHRPSWLSEWGEGLARHGKGRTLIIRTSRVTIAQLLQELLLGFRSCSFQERYQELRAEAKHGGAAHVRMVEWTFEVQRQVLVRYGFEASARGVWDMRAETGFHADGLGVAALTGVADEVVSKLRRDIHICLEMDSKGAVRLPVFHTVGDSHSRFGWPACVIQHWQGPLLCYNVDRVDLRKLHPPIREGDAICLCFGEIDCRCHVHKRITPEKTFQDVIDVIIGRYFDHLRRQVRLLPPAVRIFVYNVLPPVRKADAELNTEFPYLGEDEERLEYVRYFNKRLRKECHHTEFRFFDVYDQYADEEGFLSQQFSDGSVHVADGVWIDEVIRGLDLKPVRISELSFAT